MAAQKTEPPTQAATSAAASGRPAEYVVVARRYRPQKFDELIGQEHVARALANAISANRVGHAYLFSGARGVGKTSAARILAKALECQFGPTPTPCNECDICQSISVGSDVDVLEIDGASNRGIDEIRQLRQNVNIRPSRARFKIYIIDEVHMLTREAFNALLKTLEEPPEHVKFIFCTTEPTKIPVTILSRCQRFDFAGIRSPSIVERLKQIVAAEGVEAETAALEVLARRANGSMRDSQSLLEQLLAFGEERITAADVHALLGTAGDARLGRLANFLIERDAAGALSELDAAIIQGVEVGQLLEQLLGYFRDCMAAAVGCSPESFLFAPADQQDQIVDASRRLGLETILAIVQVLDHALSRLRYSTQGRMIAEMALVRLCSLDQLEEIPSLIAQLKGQASTGSPQASSPSGAAAAPPGTRQASSTSPQLSGSRAAAAAPKKKGDEPLAKSSGEMANETAEASAAPSSVPLAAETAAEVWASATGRLPALLSENAARFESVELAGPNRLAVTFPAKYNSCKSFCDRPDQRALLEQALREASGAPISVEFRLSDMDQSSASGAAVRRPVSQRQRLAGAAEHPMIRRAAELFDAHPVHVEGPEG